MTTTYYQSVLKKKTFVCFCEFPKLCAVVKKRLNFLCLLWNKFIRANKPLVTVRNNKFQVFIS